jgi:hypothetical protein
MNTIRTALTLLICTFALGAAAQSTPPAGSPAMSRTQGQVISSTGFPEGTLAVDPKLTYIGSDKWVLYGVADCEIHVFAEVDADKNLKRLAWVQFEGYLPTNNHTYNYDKEPFRTELGGHTFFDRVNFRKSDPTQKPRAGSDTERVLGMLTAKGIKLPAEVANIRWVRLDEARRKELMIIYIEDLAPLNLTAADLAEGGKAAGDIDKVRNGVRDRAKTALTMRMK